MQFIVYTCQQETQEFASRKVCIFDSPLRGFFFFFKKVLMKGARL